MSLRTPTPDDLLTPREVAALFRVDPKSVSRWHRQGRISAITTPGGHRRFRRAEVAAFFTPPPTHIAELECGDEILTVPAPEGRNFRDRHGWYTCERHGIQRAHRVDPIGAAR